MAEQREEATYLTLKEYELMARKVIWKYGSKFRYKFLRDEDSISFVIYRLAKADQKFDGRGSREGFRSQNGVYAVLSLIEKVCKKQKRLFKSLNDNFVGKRKLISLESMISSQSVTEDKVIFNEVIDYISNSS